MAVRRAAWAYIATAIVVGSCASPIGSTGGPGSPADTGAPASSGQASPANTPASSGGQPLTLIYTGTISESRVSYSNPTQIGISRDLELTWTMTYTGPLTFNEQNLPPEGHRVWSSIRVSGSLLQVGYDGFGQPTVQCSGTYAAVDDLIAPPLLQNPSDTGDPNMISLRLVAPNVGAGVKVVGDCDGDPNGYGSPSIPSSANVTETAPHLAFDVSGGGSQDFDRTLDFNDGTTDAPDNNHLVIQSTVSLIPADDSCQVAVMAPSVALAAYRATGSGSVAQVGGPICPVITWANVPAGATDPNPVNDKEQDVAIGQAVKLRAGLSDGSDPTSHRIEWQIGGSAVAGFDVDPPRGSHGHVIPLPTPTIGQEVTVYWPKTGSQSVFLLIDGHPASTTFVTHAPTATLTADLCGVGLDTTLPHGGLPLPVFGPGVNDVCPSSGIAWHGNMAGGMPGKLGMIQLILDTLKNDNGPCDVDGAPEGYTGYAADQQAIYGGYTNSVPGSYEDSDSPGLPLGGKKGTFTRLFVAQDDFVYKPDVGVDAIWVPMRRILWRWTATATGSGQTWTVTGSPANATPTTMQSTEWSQFPDWTWVGTNANGFTCH